jgi:TRAP-type C4-dicarboxylate transport system substrate-binding protein
MGSLPAEDQRIIRECALYAEMYQKTILRERQDSAAARLAGQGVTFYPEEIPHMQSSQWETLRSRFIGGGITDE